MTTKISSEMFPLNELNGEYMSRVRSTGFTSGTKPSVIVNLHLFNLLMGKLPDTISEEFHKVLKKALQNISFYTTGGRFILKDVDYIFQDQENRLVVVLQSGEDFVMLTPPVDVIQTQIMNVSPLSLIVSTYALKEYFTENMENYPYLKDFSNLCDNILPQRSMITLKTSECVGYLINNPWVKENITSCIKELDDLFDKASFVLCKEKTKQ